MLSCDYSPSGTYLVVTGDDQVLHLYQVHYEYHPLFMQLIADWSCLCSLTVSFYLPATSVSKYKTKSSFEMGLTHEQRDVK